MKLRGISLQHFRCYSQHTFLFPSDVTVVVAKNASGKTSLAEAIALLATGESFRAEEVEQMISFEEELGRVKGKLEVPESETGGESESNGEELEVLLTRGILQGKRVQSKLYSVNGVRRRKKDFIGHFFTVVFRPEDMRLVEGSPGRRRQFVDTVLTTTDREYHDSLKTYEEALKKRNRLLGQVQEGQMSRSVLTFWTNTLVKHGEVLQEKRRQFFSFFDEVEFPMPFSVQYLPSLISAERMAEYAEREILAGHMLIGPHKDDFLVNIAIEPEVKRGTTRQRKSMTVNVAEFGSRGQQRMAVLWLKLGELQYVMQKTEVRPLLLLDDILSELDEEHRGQVLHLLKEGQAIVTTIEESMVSEVEKVVSAVEVIRL